MFRIAELSLKYPTAEQPFALSMSSMEFLPGQISLLWGRNGSGKSSIFNAICNLIPAHIAGECQVETYWQDRCLSHLPCPELFRYIAYLRTDIGDQLLFPTIDDEITFSLQNMGLEPEVIRTRLKEAKDFFGLHPLSHRKPEQLSMGQQKILLMALIMAMHTPIVFLDEASAYLSESSLSLCRDFILQLAQSGKVVLVADHAPKIQDLCHRRINVEEYVHR